MTAWMVRAGRNGEREETALEERVVVIDWRELDDLSGATNRDEIRARLASAAPHLSDNAVTNYAGQIWSFVGRIQKGDLVVLPLKSSAAVALGRVVGDYRFEPEAPLDARHRRRVEWLREDVPRSALGQDLLYTLGAFLTVCQVRRNNAEDRLRAIAAGRDDPGPLVDDEELSPASSSDEATAPIDLERYGRDRIQALITRHFAGHELARLVDQILEAQGYHTFRSPAGPDGGVDVLAGGGPMGFDAPRICVQVKTGEADAPTVRDLQGTMNNFGAEQGLLVAWRGFKRGVREAARRNFFRIRLWDSDDVIDQLTAVYERLPAETRDQIPLTQVWTVVSAAEEPA
jgi:restriction system protein